MPHKFSVSYSVVTDESAEFGDFAEIGFLAESVSLREAVSAFNSSRTNMGEEYARESIGYSITRYDHEWDSAEDYSVTLHIPRAVSVYTVNRIVRLLGA